ncbi:MAG: pyruvate kinase [Planctomycetota bacterium]|jgi:pyruvate kinase
MSRTKIVATIGPRTNDADLIRKLVQAGMDVARLNGAHADLEWHSSTIDLIRRVAPDVPIILDLPGRKVRTNDLEREPNLNAGDVVIFTTSENPADERMIPVSGIDLQHTLAVGDVLRADDGTMSFTVVDIQDADVVCRAESPGTLRSRKGISLPSSVGTALLTAGDRRMIAFAKEKNVDFVGVSFVVSSEHVEAVRAITGAGGPGVIAKIESQDGLDHLEEIVEVADALLVDRGDLAIQTALESLVISQKHILKVAGAAAKPVIVATEMLHTMIENPFPTKAEVCDISNAVLDGASAVMLSGETAVGKYPVEAVSLMQRITAAAAAHEQVGFDHQVNDRRRNIPPAITEALSLLSRRLPVTKIVAITIAGFAARMAAASRPRQPILAVSNNAEAARSFNLLPGTEGVYVDVPFSRTSTDHIAKCLEILWRQGKVAEDDLVLVTSLGYPKSGNRMNMIQTHTIADLCDALEWKERLVEENTDPRSMRRAKIDGDR